MGANEILAVDTLSLADFRRALQARLDEAHAMLAKLDPAVAGQQEPTLGGFEDAHEAEERHADLHQEYLARLHQLIDSLTAVHEGTGAIITRFESVEALNAARQRELLNLLLNRVHG